MHKEKTHEVSERKMILISKGKKKTLSSKLMLGASYTHEFPITTWF